MNMIMTMFIRIMMVIMSVSIIPAAMITRFRCQSQVLAHEGKGSTPSGAMPVGP